MLVFGEGSPEADLMFIGGTPDAAEDKQGKPFVGAIGNMLTWSIERVGLSRAQVYVTNIVKCRPPDARDPSPDEIATCAPFLHAQIWLVRPKVIVTLGRLAGNLLTGQEDVSLSKLRQGDWSYRNAKTNLTVPVVPTHHPSYVLRKRGSAVERHRKSFRPGTPMRMGGEESKRMKDANPALELPAAPTEPDNMMSLEHVVAYEKDLLAWGKAVHDLVEAEKRRVLDRRSLLQFRRNSPLWKGW